MRTSLLALALVLGACGRSDHTAAPPAATATPTASSSSSGSGPDQVVLRFPQDGGTVRAYAFPALDSVIWSSAEKAPGVERVLGFDDAGASVLVQDGKGAPVRVDLRLGDVSRDKSPKLTSLTSADGSAAYGIAEDGDVVRLTPAGSWRYEPHLPARDVIPDDDGGLLVISSLDDQSLVWLIHPPDSTVADSIVLPHVTRAIPTQVGDRVYFTLDSGVVGMRSRDLQLSPPIHLEARVRALVPTPSGDRLYVALDSTRRLTEIDRYSRKVDARIDLPSPASALRIDPMGRYVLARATKDDSAYVIAVGTDSVVGGVATEWRTDLPAVAPNGWIALLRGKDVVFVDGSTLHTTRTIKNGARDRWLFVAWNGFRPRAKGLDQPVTFGDDTAASDSSAPPASDTAAQDTASVASSAHAADSAPHAASPPPAPPASHPAAVPAPTGFTVQFGALRSEQMAKDLAQTITVNGGPPHVVATSREGVTIYRVIIGPFPTRAEAERIARTSGKSYWVYEGAP